MKQELHYSYWPCSLVYLGATLLTHYFNPQWQRSRVWEGAREKRDEKGVESSVVGIIIGPIRSFPAPDLFANIQSLIGLYFWYCWRVLWSVISSEFGCESYSHLAGRVAQSVGHLTRKSAVLGSIPGLAMHILSFLLSLIQERQLSVAGESMCAKYWLTA